MKSAKPMCVSTVTAFALGFCLLSGCGGGGGSLNQERQEERFYES